MSAEVKARRTVIVLGQTPPPWHGQAVMIEQLVRAPYEKLEVVHVRMAFSKTHEEIGQLRARKLVHLAAVIARTLLARVRHGDAILYYPPAGAAVVPVLRDLALLLCLRPLFSRTVFHFHAAGVSRMEHELPPLLRPLFRRAYRDVDLAIVPAEQVTQDAEQLGAKSIAVIPHGLPDEHPDATVEQLTAQRRQRSPQRTSILYVGRLCTTKGVPLLLDAVAALVARGIDVDLGLVGAPESPELLRSLTERIATLRLSDRVDLAGVLTGEQKCRAYAAADLLCFPTFYDAETFGLVVLEAMQHALPVVASRFRSLPSIVVHGETGLLAAPNDLHALTDALATLARDPELRLAMGSRGRQRYLDHFDHDRFARRIEAALCAL